MREKGQQDRKKEEFKRKDSKEKKFEWKDEKRRSLGCMSNSQVASLRQVTRVKAVLDVGHTGRARYSLV